MNSKYLELKIKEKSLDAIFLLSDFNRTWYTKFVTTAGHLVVTKEKSTLFLDGRYITAGKEKVSSNIDIKLLKKQECFYEWVKEQNFSNVGIEEDYVSIKMFKLLEQKFPKINFVLINGSELRLIKTNEEVKLIKKAIEISKNALDATKHLIKPGVSEIEIRNNLESQMLYFGAKKPGFDSIVVSGERSALPHGNPSDKLLKEGELVTIDFGAEYSGYTADITRTFQVGKVTDKKLLEIFEIVKEAQNLGIKAVKPGIKASDIDKICRDYITSKGYGEYFTHGTGHGLGIEVHEEPYVSPLSKSILEEGNVITVEPGIYIPKLGGTRFEDDILVTKDGYEILSR